MDGVLTLSSGRRATISVESLALFVRPPFSKLFLSWAITCHASLIRLPQASIVLASSELSRIPQARQLFPISEENAQKHLTVRLPSHFPRFLLRYSTLFFVHLRWNYKPYL